MIGWNGLGFLVAVIGFAALILTENVAEIITGDDQFYQRHGWVAFIGMLVAATLTYGLHRLLLLQKGRVVIDKETGEEIVLKSKHSLLAIPVELWPFVFIAFGLVIAIFEPQTGAGRGATATFNPFDPPHYETPLPNGLRHYSNGGELGRFGMPFKNNTSNRVYPVEKDWYCNEFAAVGDDIIGIEIQYARRAFVDPPVAKRWFYLDTKDRTAITFESLNALRGYCESMGHTTLPEFVHRTSQTRRTDLP